MARAPQAWHNRFRQQAAWTEQVRRYLLGRLNPGHTDRILETGCGTGVITESIAAYTHAFVYGLDLNLPFLRLAQQFSPWARLTAGDALRLPFPSGTFDIVVCHFFLLWVADPGAALAEMARVTRPGGSVIAFAEPDYGGRIDYPPTLAELGRLQAEALRRQGANPNLGRALSALFHAAGLEDVETGVLGGQWRGATSATELALEWETLEADLAGMVPEAELRALRQVNEEAWATGQRVLFVPTFYATGRKKSS